MIEFNDVSKIYDKKPALQHMSLTIETGEFFVIVGTSGSGKTTTLKMINRLLTPTEGTVLIDGTDISQLEPRQLRLNIGYVLQTGALFPNLTVYENIEINSGNEGLAQGRTAEDDSRLFVLSRP